MENCFQFCCVEWFTITREQAQGASAESGQSHFRQTPVVPLSAAFPAGFFPLQSVRGRV